MQSEHRKSLSEWTKPFCPGTKISLNSLLYQCSVLRIFYQEVNDVWSCNWPNVRHCWTGAQCRVTNLCRKHFGCVQCNDRIDSTDAKTAGHCTKHYPIGATWKEINTIVVHHDCIEFHWIAYFWAQRQGSRGRRKTMRIGHTTNSCVRRISTELSIECSLRNQHSQLRPHTRHDLQPNCQHSMLSVEAKETWNELTQNVKWRKMIQTCNVIRQRSDTPREVANQSHTT